MHRVHARWTGAGRAVHHGPTVAQTDVTAACSPELGLRPFRCTKARGRGHKMEREARGTRLGSQGSSGLKGARAVQNGEAAALGERAAQAGREGNRSGERCFEARGGCSPFIVAEGAPESGGRGG
jgi:hypothetical protein